jgi:hypothetical protein
MGMRLSRLCADPDNKNEAAPAQYANLHSLLHLAKCIKHQPRIRHDSCALLSMHMLSAS